jgi:serine/threonine protein kinase/Tol biopolymer transport system component
MSPAPGERIGPYEITAPLGEGGMGVVFRARDTQLLRDVAIKFLPGRFENDPERLGRFQREAQVLASLNHPNIAQIYGFQPAGASGAIVMELVEGETLADRLKRGVLPVEQAISIAKQIVDALETAHKRGVVHRDLKPANIKLTRDGKVKVLDFGLAKALIGEDSSLDASNSPTIMSRSIAGVIMGTAAYMSPEQARGSELDATTDIWSFGCVLYELLTAKPVFTGATVTDIIAKVIEAQPNWELLPAETPISIRMLLTSALTKDRSERLQHIGDARVFLRNIEIPRSAPVPVRTGWRVILLAAVLAIALVAAGVPASIYFLRTPDDQAQIRFEIPAPGATSEFAISPDGRNVAYAARHEGKTTIWVRPMGELKARALPGTENGFAPFWSPDGSSIGFIADGRLKKISIEGGPSTTLAETAWYGGDWGRHGIILFSTAVAGSPVPAIVRISETGGAVTPVTKPGDKGHSAPQFLPDDNHFLYVASGTQGEGLELFAGSLDGKPPVRIGAYGDFADGNVPPLYAPPGYLLFVRGGVLQAQGFDPKRLLLTGQPVTLADQVGLHAVSHQGTIVYRSATELTRGLGRQLLWFDREGKTGASIGTIANYFSLALSPDNRRVAVDLIKDGNRDIWVIDLERGIPNRLTIDPADDSFPRWTPDGKKIYFLSLRGGRGIGKIYQRSAVSIGGDEAVDTLGEPDVNDIAVDFSQDGKYLVFLRTKNVAPVDIWIKPLFGDGKPVPYVQSKSFRYDEPTISPNGRWLAYATNESGIHQIVVQTFPDPTKNKWQITPRGGIYPKWRGDSRELYYLALDGKLMAVPVKEGADFEAGEPRVLFQTPLTIPATPTAVQYDVTADGKRFLFLVPGNAAANVSSPGSSDTITAIVNWTAALRKK